MPPATRTSRPGRPRTRPAVSWSSSTYQYTCTCAAWRDNGRYCDHVKEHLAARLDSADYTILRKGEQRTFVLPLYEGKALATVIVEAVPRSIVFPSADPSERAYVATHKSKHRTLEFFLQTNEGFAGVIAALESYYSTCDKAQHLVKMTATPTTSGCEGRIHNSTTESKLYSSIVTIFGDERGRVVGANAFYLVNYKSCKICFDMLNDFESDAPDV